MEMAPQDALAKQTIVAPQNALAICEPFHPDLHGQDENSTPNIDRHFLIYTTITLAEFYSNEYKSEEISLRRHRKAITLMRMMDGDDNNDNDNNNNNNNNNNNKHPVIRNYKHLAQKSLCLEIIRADELQPGQEAVAYLKTFWLRIVQRCWKKVFKQRKAILKGRMSIRTQQEHMRTGQWPPHLRYWPPFRLNLAN